MNFYIVVNGNSNPKDTSMPVSNLLEPEDTPIKNIYTTSMTVIKKLNANDKVKVKVVPDPIHNGSWNPKSNITVILVKTHLH